MLSMMRADDVPRSEDLNELRPLLRRIVGKPFRFVKASYGDELTLHLGDLVPYASLKMKDLHKGSHIVAARASSWNLEPGSLPGQLYWYDGMADLGPSPRVENLELREIESRVTIRPGAVVTDASVEALPSGPMLSLRFSDGSSLLVMPGPSGDREDDEPLSDWEIFMSPHRVLKVGPGPSWSSRTPGRNPGTNRRPRRFVRRV